MPLAEKVRGSHTVSTTLTRGLLGSQHSVSESLVSALQLAAGTYPARSSGPWPPATEGTWVELPAPDFGFDCTPAVAAGL